jgi:hypothetical protein
VSPVGELEDDVVAVLEPTMAVLLDDDVSEESTVAVLLCVEAPSVEVLVGSLFDVEIVAIVVLEVELGAVAEAVLEAVLKAELELTELEDAV